MLTEHLEKKVFGSVVLNLEPASGEANGAHHAMVVLLVRLATFDPFFPFGPNSQRFIDDAGLNGIRINR